MGKQGRKKRDDDTSSSSSALSGSDDSDSSSRRRRRHRKERQRGYGSSRRERESKRDKRKKREREKERSRRKMRREEKRKRDHSLSDDVSGSDSEPGRSRMDPEEVVRNMLSEFANVGRDLKQLLQMIDDGQAVDIRGISERSLSKRLKTLFVSLKLKESGEGVFLRPENARPVLDVVGFIIQAHMDSKEQQVDPSVSVEQAHSELLQAENRQANDDNHSPSAMPSPRVDSCGPKRRVLGPEMPSAELLAVAAKLTEAQAELREAELEEDNELFVGPPPPAVVAEAESANEAERFEEVARIMGVDADSPYEVLGANHNTPINNIKKKYWKLSLLVHPDKCPHPQAHQAFIILNKAFKEIQDPEKRKVLDEKIKLKEEQEAFKAELKAMREAAKWRRLQGISMEGDDELLAEVEVKTAPQRDEWMTTLPPERKPGMTMQSTKFSKGTKEGRGDASVWTDTPSDRAQKAKMNYLEAYNAASELASNEQEKKRSSADADIVDKYNKEKRSKSLVQKHQEEAQSRSKKKSKQPAQKEEWVGQHPWKPWDREKDLSAGRQNVKLDSENMAQGLTSRFSSGTFQRNFL